MRSLSRENCKEPDIDFIVRLGRDIFDLKIHSVERSQGANVASILMATGLPNGMEKDLADTLNRAELLYTEVSRP